MLRSMGTQIGEVGQLWFTLGSNTGKDIVDFYRITFTRMGIIVEQIDWKWRAQKGQI